MTIFELFAGGGDIELVAELNYREIATNVLGKVFVSRLGTVPQTDSGDTPASETFPRLLLDPGTLDYRLEGDLLVSLDKSGIAKVDLGTVILDNRPDNEGNGPFDSWWWQYTFAGFDYVLYAGRPGALFSEFVIVARTKIRSEPDISPSDVHVNLKSPLEILNVPLDIDRYVGIPTCLTFLTVSSAYSAPYIADYNILSYTVAVRFKVGAATTNNQFLIRQGNATPNQRIALYIGSTGGGFSGKVRARASFGGVSVDMMTSADEYVDSEWHWAVVSILDKQTAYLMIDGEVVGTYNPSASVDAPTDPLNNVNLIGSVCDLRLRNFYMTPDEARSWMAARGDGLDIGVVANINFDDAGGSVATDYSENANNAAISGVINTDFRWGATDLGMKQQAGLPMPAVHGVVANAPADYIDESLERIRIRDSVANSLATVPSFYTRGVSISPTDAGGGVYQLSGETDEPITYAYPIAGEAGSLYTDVLVDIITKRGGFTAADFSTAALNELRSILPFTSGWFIGGSKEQRLTLAPLVNDYLRGSGAHLRLTRTGLFAPGFVLGPVSPGPYGEESVLSLRGGNVNFGNAASVTGDHSIVFWIKSLTFGLDARSLDITIVNKPNLYAIIIGNDGSIRVEHAELLPLGLSTVSNFLQLETWQFFAFTYKSSTGVRKLYTKGVGGNAALIASNTASGTLGGSSADLTISNMLGAVAYPQVWSKELSAAELDGLINSPPVGNEANLIFYSPMTDGYGSVVQELVGNKDGTVSSQCRWVPIVTFDLSKLKGASFVPRQLVPAWKVAVGYAENFAPLDQADIAPTVSKSAARAFKRQRLEASDQNSETLSDFRDAFSLPANGEVLRTPLADGSQAQAVVRNWLARLAPQRSGGRLLNAGRDALIPELSDEVRVITSRYGMSSGVSYIVIQQRARYPITADLELWGGQAPSTEEQALLTEAGQEILTEAGQEIIE